MNNDNSELSRELTVEEVSDDQLDTVSGGLGFSYGQVKFEYTKQKGEGD